MKKTHQVIKGHRTNKTLKDSLKKSYGRNGMNYAGKSIFVQIEKNKTKSNQKKKINK